MEPQSENVFMFVDAKLISVSNQTLNQESIETGEGE